MNVLGVYFSIGRIYEIVSAKFGTYFIYNLVWNELGISFNTANRLIEQTGVLEIVEKMTGGQRFHIFRYTPYGRLLQESEPVTGQDVPLQTTEVAG